MTACRQSVDKGPEHVTLRQEVQQGNIHISWKLTSARDASGRHDKSPNDPKHREFLFIKVLGLREMT